MVTFQELKEDQDFLGLDASDKNIILGNIFPEFDGLPNNDRNIIVDAEFKSIVPPTILPQITPAPDDIDAITGAVPQQADDLIQPFFPEKTPSFGFQGAIQPSDVPGPEIPQTTPQPEGIGPITATTEAAKITGVLAAGILDFALSGVAGIASMQDFVRTLKEKPFEVAVSEAIKVLEDFPKISEQIPQPETEEGQLVQERINKGFEFIFKSLGDNLAETIPDDFVKTKAFISTATEGILLALIPKAIGKGKAISKKLVDGAFKSIEVAAKDAVAKNIDLSPTESKFLSDTIIGEVKGEISLEPDISLVKEIPLETKQPKLTPESVKTFDKVLEQQAKVKKPEITEPPKPVIPEEVKPLPEVAEKPVEPRTKVETEVLSVADFKQKGQDLSETRGQEAFKKRKSDFEKVKKGDQGTIDRIFDEGVEKNTIVVRKDKVIVVRKGAFKHLFKTKQQAVTFIAKGRAKRKPQFKIFDQDNAQFIEHIEKAGKEGKTIPQQAIKDFELITGKSLSKPKSKELPKAEPKAKQESAVSKFLKDEEGSISFKKQTELDKVKSAVESDPVAKKAVETQETLDASSKKTLKDKLLNARNQFVLKVIDQSGNLKRELVKKNKEIGTEVTMNHDLIFGASSEAKRLIDIAEKSMFKGKDADSLQALGDHIFSRRVVQIDKNKGPGKVKHPGGTTGVAEQTKLNALKKGDKTLFEKIDNDANSFFKEMQTVVKDLEKAEIITPEVAKALIDAGDYAPRNFLDKIDPGAIEGKVTGKITVPDSGIMALKEGAVTALEKNPQRLLQQVVTRKTQRIFRNEANKSLLKFAEEVPENGIVEIREPTGLAKDGKPVFAKEPDGFTGIDVRVKGQTKRMLMPNEMAKEWILRDPKVDSSLGEFIRVVSGTIPLRATATGLNPEFALTNLPRDIAHILFSTVEFSKHLPVALGELSVELAATFKDAVTRKGAFIDYTKQGGGMDFLTHQGRIFHGKLGGAWDAMQEYAGYIGETSEIWTRLALRRKTLNNLLKKGVDKATAEKQATWVARNYLDFSQGGSFVKAIDNAVPYLNASVQGSRGVFKAFKENPKVAIYKTAQIGTAATILHYANSLINPEAMDDIPDFVKTNNFIITTPIFKVDKDGNKRYMYFKIAKDQGQRLITKIFEASVDKTLGKDVDVIEVTKAARELITLIPDTSTIPPSMKAALGYYSNKDFWRNEDIWKSGKKIDPKEEFLPWTHPAFVKAGGLTGASPERMRFVMNQFFASNNMFVDLVGKGTRVLMDQLPGQQQKEFMDKLQFDIPVARKFIKFTDPKTKRQKEIEKLKVEDNTKAFVRNREFFNKLKESDKSGSLEEVNDFILTEIPALERKSFRRKMLSWRRLKNLPNKRFWVDLMDRELRPETKAVIFWNELNRPGSDKDELKKTRLRVPGMNSKRFRFQLFKLQRIQNKGQ